MKLPFRWQHIVIFLAATLVLVFALHTDSYAVDTSNSLTLRTDAPSFEGDIFCPERRDGVTGRVVTCIQNIMIRAAESFLERFLRYYEAAVLVTLILAVTIYGALMAKGSVRRPAADTMWLLFKIGAVALFTVQFGGMLPDVFNVMEGLINIVINYVTVSQSSACSDNGFVGQVFQVARDNPDIWDKVDCLFITLLGMGGGAAATGIFSVLGPLIFTGGIGLVIVLIGVLFVITLLFSVVRAIKIYLSSVVAICFLVCVSPIFIPLVLFKATKNIFERWLMSLLSYMLLPVFLFAYLTMMVAAFDALIFVGKNSLYFAVADQPTQDFPQSFNFREWAETGYVAKVKNPTGPQSVGDTANWAAVGKDIPGLNAQTLLGYRKLCAEGSDRERRENEEICDLYGDGGSGNDLDKMIICAMNPMVPADGVAVTRDELDDGECGLSSEDGGVPYYGFLSNEEILSFALAPNTETDAHKRRDRGCHGFWGCVVRHVVSPLGNLVGNIFGAVFRVSGWLVQGVGQLIKGFGHFVGGACRFTHIPGTACGVGEGIFTVAGGLVHAAGTFYNTAGRVLMNGLHELLGDHFEHWFNVPTLDFHKVAAYKCKLKVEREGGSMMAYDGSNPDTIDPRYISDTECTGVKDVIAGILYVLITAAVVAYLMMQWLNYIPALALQISQAPSTQLDVPFEDAVGNIGSGAQAGGKGGGGKGGGGEAAGGSAGGGGAGAAAGGAGGAG